jgi:hypothetical protein
MARHANLAVLAGAVICMLAALPVAAQSCATDNFEEANINSSFWTVETNGQGSGAVQLVTYSGNPAVEVQTFDYGIAEFLSHYFTSAVYGTVSVSVYYDNAYASGYKVLVIDNGSDSPPSSYHIFVDWGNFATYLYHPTTPPSSNWALTQLLPPQSTGWHQWMFASTPNGVSIQIDGATVFTQSAGFAFNAVKLSEQSLAGSAYFANFSFCYPPLHITSLNYATFVEDTANSFTVTTSGSPVPSLTFSPTGSLPSGVSFVDNHNGTATLSGRPTVRGRFTFWIEATNGVSPPSLESFTLTVDR